MKKLWLVFGLLVFAGACSDKQEEQNPENLPLEEVLEEGEQVVVRPNFDIKFEEETYTYKFGESQAGCDKGSDVCHRPLRQMYAGSERKRMRQEKNAEVCFHGR